MANLSDILTNYQSVDTLDSVTDRGATTTNNLTVGNLTSTGTVGMAGGSTSANLSFSDNAKALFGNGNDLEIHHDGNNSYITDVGTGSLYLRGADILLTTAGGTKYVQGAANVLRLYHTGNEKLRTSSTGVVVTGEVIAADTFTLNGATDATASIVAAANADATLKLIEAGSGDVGARLTYDGGDNKLYIQTGNNPPVTRMTINRDDGRVGIGDSTPDAGLTVHNNAGAVIATSNIARQTYTSVGNLQVSTAGSGGILIHSGASNTGYLTFGDGGVAGRILYDHTSNFMAFTTGGISERMRINSSGNVGIGTASPSAKLHIDTSGTGLKCTGPAVFGADSHTKLTTYSDSTYVGIYNGSSLTSDEAIYMGGDHTYFYVSGSEALRLTNVILYTRHLRVLADNTYDIGTASGRYNDAHITNGVTTGSDERLKQDISSLSEAETRVAVACKGLLRKWRWKDAVEEKGENARIHFGIIAQDLKAAFEAEGLDAGRYGMFMHDTWTDEETDEEHDRMGIRYSELLAFIIAAI